LSFLLTVEEMYEADRAALELGVQSLVLMEAAGRSVAHEIQQRWPSQPVTILCGPGNNGGDGFVIARYLREDNWSVRVGLLGEVTRLKGDAAVNAQRWAESGEIIEPLTLDLLEGTSLVVDALFGAGLCRGLQGFVAELIEEINNRGLTCVAVDVPSGINGNTGSVMLPQTEGEVGIAVKANLTVTFFRPKPGHYLLPGSQYCGELAVNDIGIPEKILEEIRPVITLNGPDSWKLPSLSLVDHKYSRGHAIVFGSKRMSGAARLAASAARRVGAGLVTVAAPEDSISLYLADSPGLLFTPVDSSEDVRETLAEPRCNGVVLGPGYGVGFDTCQRVLDVLKTNKACVLDADALTSFQSEPERLFQAIAHRPEGAPTIMTPHEGEFGRIFDLVGPKTDQALRASELSGAIIVYKGNDTVVAAPDGRLALNSSAPPWLATGGSGDVLTGIILGLLVQGMSAWEAACAAVWLHGQAAQEYGRGMIAEDLILAIPMILRQLTSDPR